MKAKVIRDRILDKGAGWIFSAMDFADTIDRNSVDQTLFRLSQKGVIRKLTTGLYDTPIVNKKLGAIPQDPDKIARALARKFDTHLQVNPAQAAYLLGLTQQIPSQSLYLTDGISKTINAGNYTIKFARVSPKKLLGIGTKAGIVIQSIYYFGKDAIDLDFFIPKVKAQLNDKDIQDLSSLMNKTPIWMQPIIKKVIHDV